MNNSFISEFESSVISNPSQTPHQELDQLVLFESSVISNPSQTTQPSTIYTSLFESSVISNPSQTFYSPTTANAMFESSVISNPSQTNIWWIPTSAKFESSVISNPSQATMTTPDRLTKNEIANAHRRGVFLLHNIICQLRRCGVFFIYLQHDGARGTTGEWRGSLRAASYFRCAARRKR